MEEGGRRRHPSSGDGRRRHPSQSSSRPHSQASGASHAPAAAAATSTGFLAKDVAKPTNQNQKPPAPTAEPAPDAKALK